MKLYILVNSYHNNLIEGVYSSPELALKAKQLASSATPEQYLYVKILELDTDWL